MAINVPLSIVPPPGMTDAEAVRLFSDYNKYPLTMTDVNTGLQVPNTETRAAYSKRMIALQVQQQIYNQRIDEAHKAIAFNGQVTVE